MSINNKDAKLAEEVGFRASEGRGHRDDAPLDTSWKQRGRNSFVSTSDRAAMAMEREMQENRVLRESRSKIDQITNGEMLTMADLLDQGDTEGMAMLVEKGVKELVKTNVPKLYRQSYDEPNDATMLFDQLAAKADPTDGLWLVEKTMVTTKSGRQVPVWVVNNPSDQKEINKKFRFQEVAQRVAAIMNRGGPGSMVRVQQLCEKYDKYLEIRRAMKANKKLILEGDNSKTARNDVLQARLNELAVHLGL